MLELPDTPYDKFENCPACERRGLNTESKAYKQCIFCDYLLIIDNKKYKNENNSFIFTPKMNYFTSLIREMNVKYEGDNTFITLILSQLCSQQWLSLIQDIVDKYNYTIHSSTKFKPSETFTKLKYEKEIN